MLQSIISPVPVRLVKAELTSAKRMRSTNKSKNELYVITAADSPNVMREIGRLRETAFRAYGGGTGLAVDIDEYDTMPNAYRQLIVWSPEEERILGGYRFLCGSDVRFAPDGQPCLATSHLYRFSRRFIDCYLPHTVELGRSFVALDKQVTGSAPDARKGIFILDNLWDGLGALSVIDPSLKYFFGKATMYASYPRPARDLLIHFLYLHFPDPDNLITPHAPVPVDISDPRFTDSFPYNNYKDNYRVLNGRTREYGINVPPLINAYMSLSPKMRVCGTTFNESFGGVEETAILIPIDEILEEKKCRHVDSYLEKERCSASLLHQG
ncbi:MAG: GNAT family N-acetyltransferase [Tannerellaceae bacterium]|nr:GNAT family N-acetyltransferase [Tannerellaceae bacterium]